jgi:hypothetical protein
VTVEARERGFIVLLRRVQSSALWRSLRADQRGVFVTMLLLANWRTAKARWRDQWYAVERGEFAHTLQTIAVEANASVAVVRSTLAALMADDTCAGGNGPTIVERYPIPNTGPGTGPRVLRWVNYARFQDVPDRDDTASHTGLTQVSHGPRTDLAEREPVEQEEPEALSPAGAREAAPLTPRDLGALHRELMRPVVLPETCRLLAELERRGFEAQVPKPAAAKVVEAAILAVTVPVAADRVMALVEADRALSVLPRPFLGWYLDAISGRKPSEPRAIVARSLSPMPAGAPPPERKPFIHPVTGELIVARKAIP